MLLLIAVNSLAAEEKVVKAVSRPTAALPATIAPAINTAIGTLPGQRVVSLTFKQMGAWSALKLRGVDGSQTLSFSTRADEIVVAAKLRIGYDYSPSLLPDLSQFKILLNDRIVMMEALPQDKALGNTREINLDPRLFGDVNLLKFNFIGHYSRQCENPNHSSLWLTVNDLGRLELTLASIPTNSDLRNLPAPFFDRREQGGLVLPFVFVKNPSRSTIQTAGVVASWFGLQAKERGARFPTSFNTLPNGNAVVFLPAGATIDGLTNGNGTDKLVASGVTLIPNPRNTAASLLVITGRTDEELARSARAIALYANSLAGSAATIKSETPVALRQPYDAPAWINLQRPVRFGELARPAELRVEGNSPPVIRVNYRVAPDLFSWRSPGVPLHVKYRAARLQQQKDSALGINLNGQFIDTLPLSESAPVGKKPAESSLVAVSGKPADAVREAALLIPSAAVSGRDQLQFSYTFDLPDGGDCKSLPPDNLQATIDPDSTIDFSQFPHHVGLPDLALFATMGFPFTRMADLAETAVVMPDSPNPEELAVYLMLMGRMGEATGYPVLRHAVVSAAEIDKFADHDLIVIGSEERQALLKTWAERLPLVQIGGERRVRAPSTSWQPLYRWNLQESLQKTSPKGSLNLAGSGDLSTIMAIESPLQSSRSAVFLYADKAPDLRKLTDVMLDPERLPGIGGDLAIVDDLSVSQVRAGPMYYLGALPWSSKIRWFFSDHPLLLGFIGLFVSMLIAIALYRNLRRLKSKRSKKITLI